MLDPLLLRDQLSEIADRLATRSFILDTTRIELLEARREVSQQRSVHSPNELESIEAELNALLLSIPNLPDPSVPAGTGSDDNIEVRRWGTPKTLSFEPKDHVVLGEIEGGLDYETAAKLSGSRFAVLRGPIARLHRALAQFLVDLFTDEYGYQELAIPYLVKPLALQSTGQIPGFDEDLFKVSQERDGDFYLIPNVDASLIYLMTEKIVDAERLPLKLVAHAPCFRNEVSAGRDSCSTGRQHQCEEVGMVQVVKPSKSVESLERLTDSAERALQLLGLPYRVMAKCAGDMSFSAAKSYGIEVWMPSLARYREVSCCSNFVDFQARRVQAYWRGPETATPEVVHTLSGSISLGYLLFAVMENYQRIDGSISTPKIIRPYMYDAKRAKSSILSDNS